MKLNGKLIYIISFLNLALHFALILPMSAFKWAFSWSLLNIFSNVLSIRVINHPPILNNDINPLLRNRGIDTFTDEDLWTTFRFRKNHLRELLRLLNLPETMNCSNRTSFNSEYGFLLMLFRLENPSKHHDESKTFGRDFNQLSRILTTMFNYFCFHHRGKTQDLSWYSDRFDSTIIILINEKITSLPMNFFIC